MNLKRTTLPNGLRLLTVPMEGTQTVTVLITVGAGSRYENEKIAGISHFLEHMFFKGTKKRPNTLAISEELDSVGGEYNAFTGKDRTSYFAKVDSKHFEKALDVVSDIYLNSKLDSKEIEKEKGTILQELNMYEDTPIMNIGDVFENLLYDGKPLGREIIGHKKTIASLKREDFIKYLNRFYISNDTVLCIAGKFDENRARKLAAKYFSRMRRNKKPEFIRVSEKQSGPAAKVKNKKTDQTHLALGVRTFDYNHKDRFILALLSVILGGNMSSRLFIEVREKRGLAYYVRTGIEAFADCGYLVTQAGVDHDKLKLTAKTILNEYRKISQKKVRGKELKRAKEYIKGKSIMDLESSDQVAAFFSDQECKGRKIMTPAEIFRKIEAVTPADILRIAKKIFVPNRINLAVIGPHKEKDISWIKS